MTDSIDKLNEHAWSLRNSDTSEAFRLSQKSFVEAQKLHYVKGLANSLLLKGFCQHRHSDYNEALHTLTRSLELFDTIDDTQGRRRALNTLGIIHGSSGNLTGALKTFLQVQILCQTIDDREAEGDALNNIGMVYKLLGDNTNALEYHLQSLPLYEASGTEQGIYRTFHNIGSVYIETDRFQEALSYFTKSLDHQDQKADPLTYALTLNNIGNAYRKLGSYVDAFRYQAKSLSLMKNIKDKYGESVVLEEIGLTHFDLGDNQEAIKYLLESLSLKQKVGDSTSAARVCLNLGNVYLACEDSEKALSVYKQVLIIVEKTQAKTEHYKAYYGLAKTYKLKENYELAYEHLEQYTEMRDALYSEASDQRFHALRVSYEVEQAEKEKEIYRIKSVSLSAANEQLTTLKDQLQKQASEDPLTHLYNRRYFNEKLELEFDKVKHSDMKMSVMVCDIDNFKKVNDTFSHQVGDEVLKQVATIFTENVRSIDTVARYGGEEFVVLLPETTAAEAYGICDRLRRLVSSTAWEEIHPDLQVTISMGLCDDTSSKDAHEMISKADDSLYMVKRNGKNHVLIWEEAHSTALSRRV